MSLPKDSRNRSLDALSSTCRLFSSGRRNGRNGYVVQHRHDYADGSSIKSIESFTNQDESQVTQAPKIKKDLSFVDFASKTAAEVFNLFRALNYDYPLRCMWGEKVVFLRSMAPIEKPEVSGKFLPNAAKYEAGTVLYCKERKKLLIRCKDNWIYCDEVQIMPKSQSVMASVIGSQFEKEDQKFCQFKGYYYV